MTLCINPICYQQNSMDASNCASCGSSLLLNGEYRAVNLLSEINARRFTDVYEAIDSSGQAKVLKVLVRPIPKMVQLLQREAMALSDFQDEEILGKVPKFEKHFTFSLPGNRSELYCLVVEKISGQTLSQWISSGNKASDELILKWFKQIIYIIDYLNRHNYIHRDINPSNIIVKPNGDLALIDFGGIRSISSSTYLTKLAINRIEGSLPDEQSITALVSLGYTPTEQMRGKAVVQSDYYALGRTLVHIITGYPPHQLEADTKIAWHQYATGIAKPLLTYIDKLMSESVLRRPKNTLEILDYLDKQLPNQIKLYRLRSSKIVWIGGILLVLGAFFGLYNGGKYILSKWFLYQGMKYIGEGKLSQARQEFEKSVSVIPQSATFNNLGLVCKQINDLQCAKINFNKSIEIDPLKYPPYFNLASVYEDENSLPKAITLYEQAVNVSQGKAPEPLNNLARLLIIEGSLRKAESLLKDSLKLTDAPKNLSVIYKNLGWLYFIQDRDSEAKEYLDNSIFLNPRQASSYCLKAKISSKKGIGDVDLWSNCLSNYSEDASSPEVIQWRSEYAKNKKYVKE